MDQERKMMMVCLLLAAFSSTVFSEEWKVSVVKDLDALVTSCVVVPCSFTHPRGYLPTSRLRGIWHLSNKHEDSIYHEDNTRVLESFRGRTKLLGKLGQNNCTLEILQIKDHDNGPFCVRIEIAETAKDTTDKFSFVDECVKLKMLSEPPAPTLQHPKTATQDHPFTITCSVTHTCPSHIPTLTWSRGAADDITTFHRQLTPGVWEAQSILTFTPKEKDDHSEINCTAQFNGGKKSISTMNLYVKRTENYNHIIIPAAVGLGMTAIFGVLCIFMVKKYKRRITELQSRDGSMWNRLSRLSRRIRSTGPGPSHSNQSKMPKGDRPNNMNSKACANQKVSKPRFPSPKSQPKSCSYSEDHDDGDDYMNTADLNVYGNL